ncbi:MAG: nucleotide pyrophosphatase [Gemmatimonas sp.]|nr:nucleotide pyrophosphatase [Gemmatimonas sp.]
MPRRTHRRHCENGPRLARGRGLAVLVGLAAVGAAAPAAAYIGPGAGFALGGSVLFGLAGVFVALGALLLWPLRTLLRYLRGRRRLRRARARRVVVLGLDGLDPGLVKQGLREGRLPHLRRLAAQGGFRPLSTTTPAMSPVAWSGFATGVDAGRHNIFDFLNRDLRTCLPVLSSTRLETSDRVLKLGPWRLPLGKPRFELLRRSKAFWQVLGEHGVKATVLRVPITFPPEKVDGQMLSAMCVPDLRGTQGTFSWYSADPEQGAPIDGASAGVAPVADSETIGGVRNRLERDGDLWRARLAGPDDLDGRPLSVPMEVRIDAATRLAHFRVGGRAFTLGADRNSDWIRVAFRAGPGLTAHGICKFRVTSFEEPVGFYVTPVHLDPEKPALTISHPAHYAVALGKLHGPFATLGLAEDTWALNERVIDEQAFLDQAYEIHEERRRQFFHALDRQRTGSITVVFDATDRIQHMFFRYLDPAHPANAGKDVARHRHAIRDLYDRADALVGETMARLRPGDVLLVVSDHGFKTFQRGVNLNTWLREHGYLRLLDDPAAGPPPALAPGVRVEPTRVDWSRTRAYATGLGGFYLNLKGREARGIVEPGAADALKLELAAKLRELRDPGRGCACVNGVWDGRECYHGPYVGNGPDLVVGYKAGWRTGWDAAVGRVTADVFEDNTRSWSGDHCVDPRLVPGILFSSLPFAAAKPALTDLAPTILDLFGIAKPAWMTGCSLLPEGDAS